LKDSKGEWIYLFVYHHQVSFGLRSALREEKVAAEAYGLELYNVYLCFLFSVLYSKIPLD
jgi:hypothetical protein